MDMFAKRLSWKGVIAWYSLETKQHQVQQEIMFNWSFSEFGTVTKPKYGLNLAPVQEDLIRFHSFVFLFSPL